MQTAMPILLTFFSGSAIAILLKRAIALSLITLPHALLIIGITCIVGFFIWSTYASHRPTSTLYILAVVVGAVIAIV